ncbi:MAG: molybdopterin molybdotransferase MoeA [Rhodobacteraceae bacterium]|nr:molybdopterin molybdotransferase MoeA [Paracoccaceae bacterium]
MISVGEALGLLFELCRPLQTETLPLRRAAGRVLRAPVEAKRDQPPFAASAMDGYAIIETDHRPGAVLDVIGQAAAGAGFQGRLRPGEAVRIFTGAPVPEGAERVVLQEDVTRAADRITLAHALEASANIRAAGQDFRRGDTIPAPRALSPSDLALIAAMNQPSVSVTRKPVVAIMATGDELVMPGESPGPDQIIASNSFALAAMAEAAGAEVRMLPIARDNEPALRFAFDLARGADLVVTIGGASVGDHDLVGPVAQKLGLERSFYKIAMRPGKPLMAGRLGESVFLGLPGNPVSSIVCGHIFMLPMLRVMLGLPVAPAPALQGRLAVPVGENGPRAHYMRAASERREGTVWLTPSTRQDSALLSVLASSDALLIRPPHDPARAQGDPVDFVPLR